MTEAQDPPQDLFHVTLDAAYRKQAEQEAAHFDKPRRASIDVEAPVTDAYRNERNTGDPAVPWYDTIHTYGTFRRGCALGSGGAKQRTRILEQNPDLHLTVYDISKESLVAMERDLGARFPGRVVTQAVDLNFVELAENSFDLIISSGCIHHLYNLEHIAFQIDRSLTDDGYFFLEDYVGEARFQFTEEKKASFERAFHDIQGRHRALRHWQVKWPDLDDWIYSPFEAVRSDETLDVLRRYLTEVQVRTSGAILGLGMFVRASGPLGRPESFADVVLRWLASMKRRFLGGHPSSTETRSLLATDLIPLDREVSEAGSLRPISAFAIYRKRGAS